MRCIWNPKWIDKRFRIRTYTDIVRIDKQVIRETVSVGYLNVFGYKIKVRFCMEKVR